MLSLKSTPGSIMHMEFHIRAYIDTKLRQHCWYTYNNNVTIYLHTNKTYLAARII